ncbi:hypothetical protein MSEDJ_36820 [Mycolicibacterium sediminis]|uniref:Uncharacterized protein n=1 Tax=Mycolicibacterium sediminis TaxID=1286180 RepID=A0A7I7QUL5_9MYCO|nr:hypothetical protein MSEDJ_36820 [Mycolicibacterium sediminis]
MCTATSGSSTGFTVLRCAVMRRASRARTRRDALVVDLGGSAAASAGMTGIGWVWVSAESSATATTS